MGDFIAYAEDEEAGLDVLVHFGILGQKHGQRNGPPYPLGSGDHSAKEKQAASAAGVKVGSDSGKGSIDNVKKKKSKPKKPLTPEERRAQALEAVSKGDKKKITKNMDQLTTDELRDAETRARLKESLSKSDPDHKSKADKEKDEVIKSGDKEKIQAYADKLTYNELAEAMNKMNLMAQLNYVAPPPTAMDKLRKAAEAAGKFKDAAEKSIGAYNQVAKIMNTVNKDANWPIVGEKPRNEEKKAAETIAKDVGNQVQETRQQQIQKSYKEQADEALKNAKIDYKNEKKLQKWMDKQEAKEAEKQAKKNQKHEETKESKSSKDHEYIKKEGEGEDAKYTYKEDTKAESATSWRSTWNSVADVDNTRSISDDLTPAEQAFLDSFKKR